MPRVRTLAAGLPEIPSSSMKFPFFGPAADYDRAEMPDAASRRRIDVLVVSSVALSFISFWRAAAIVLCDLASTAYYIGGISEQAIGKAAPWFILGVMLFSYAVRAVYVESCTMFTRGGVYKVVKEAMGGNLAKLSVSALMFDYILTGPISAVSAGQYIVGLISDLLTLITGRLYGMDKAWHFTTDHPHAVNVLCVLIAVGVTAYFWRTNIKGIGESSDKAMKIMKATTVMGIVIIGWSVLTLLIHPERLRLPPVHPVFTSDSTTGREGSLGWLAGLPGLVGMLGVIMAFGHSLLAMSGEESLAQVNREIQAPKTKNLLRAGFVIFLYSMLLTSLISFFAVFIIPDGKRVTTTIVPNGAAPDAPSVVQVDYLRKDDATGQLWGYKIENPWAAYPKVGEEKAFVLPGTHVERGDGGYRDNLINGLVQYLAGPGWMKIGMECLVVVVGFLILAGAVNTSIVGSNGVMNRLAEDGVLNDWFLHPQRRFGTTHRLINVVAVLQTVTIVASWGDVNTLGEAYAFGVIWSFVFKTLAMVVLRFRDRSKREYEVPMNIRFGNGGKKVDLPVGILAVFLALALTAVVNLATKKTATIWGLGFTAAFLGAFVICERIAHGQRRGKHHEHLEQFNQQISPRATAQALGLQHGAPILVAVRSPHGLANLERVLCEVNTSKEDVVVLTCKVLAQTEGISEKEMCLDERDRGLLTGVVEVAERLGKSVAPLVLPTNNPLHAIALTARDLNAKEVVLGVSEKMHAITQLEEFALAWGAVMADTPSMALQSVDLKSVAEAPAVPPAARGIRVRITGPGVDMRQEVCA
jgi:hypothetical protein